MAMSHDGRALEPGDDPRQEEERQHDRQMVLDLSIGNDLVHVAELQRAEIAQPRRAGREPERIRKTHVFALRPVMVGAEPTMATISHENSRTTIVRMAVAVSESVFRMPHLPEWMSARQKAPNQMQTGST